MIRFILSILSVYLVLQPAAFAKPSGSPSTPSVTSQPRETSIAERNQASGKTFLEENAKKAGVHTLPSGLQYKILTEGDGTSPGPTDFVTVNYRGTLPNGTEFDSSYNHHAPATFAVNAVILGWSEAIQLMKPGAKWTIYVPPNLAYGKEGAGRLIGPNATLIFDIELLSVKSALDEDPDGLVDATEGEG